MHYEDDTPNLVKYSTRDGRWGYNSESMTSIIEVVKRCYKDGRLAMWIGLDDIDDDEYELAMNGGWEDDDDEVVEIANPNPVVRAPTIEISSGSDMEPEVDGEVERVPHQYDIMNEDSDPEDDFDDPEDYDFTPESYRERNDRRDATSIWA